MSFPHHLCKNAFWKGDWCVVLLKRRPESTAQIGVYKQRPSDDNLLVVWKNASLKLGADMEWKIPYDKNSLYGRQKFDMKKPHSMESPRCRIAVKYINVGEKENAELLFPARLLSTQNMTWKVVAPRKMEKRSMTGKGDPGSKYRLTWLHRDKVVSSWLQQIGNAATVIAKESKRPDDTTRKDCAGPSGTLHVDSLDGWHKKG